MAEENTSLFGKVKVGSLDGLRFGPDKDTGKTIKQRLEEAVKKGDTDEQKRLDFAAGIQSAAVGAVTGIPDLAIMGINWAGTTNIKDLRSRVLDAVGVPKEASAKENNFIYDLPEYTLMAVGLGQLVKSGFKGLKNWRADKRMNTFLETLPKPQANRFKEFMVNGQGADDPTIAAVLQQLKGDPKYSELFTTLDKAATKKALEGMTPPPSRVGSRKASEQAVKAISDKVDEVKAVRDTAGDVNFNRAYALAGDRPLVSPNNTRDELFKLAKKYENSKTPAGKAAYERIVELFQDTSASPKKSVPEIQSMLSEFGKKASPGDAAVTGLSFTDEQAISSAIFRGLKKDLSDSFGAATGKDKTAIGALLKARNDYQVGSENYNRLISQGFPKFLQNKDISGVDPEEMLTAYKGLNTAQRTFFRKVVGDKAPEALKNLDTKVFNEFVTKGFKTLPDGTMGTDLGALATEWQKLNAKNPNAAGMLMDALGTNAAEFSDRMKDAAVFARKMQLGGATPEKAVSVIEAAKKTLPGVAGVSGGYGATKAVDLSLQVAEKATAPKGLSPDQLMKVLLTKDGANFLKQASLSKTGQNTLEALTNLDNVVLTGKNYLAAGAVASQQMEPSAEDVYIPEDDAGVYIPEDDEDVYIPEDVLAPQQEPSPPPQPMAAPAVAPVVAQQQGFDDTDNQVRALLERQATRDPRINVDYVFNAYKTGNPAQRQQVINMLQGAR